MTTNNRSISVERYLTYLDKEMTIMGILSGFCIAAIAASIKTLTDHDVIISRYLWHASPAGIVFAHMFLLFAGLWFYDQRSLLAWYYGQIALQDSGYSTARTLDKWLEAADGWDTWINYQRGFWFLTGAFCELGLAGVAANAYSKNGQQVELLSSALRWGYGIGCAVAILVIVLVQKLILERWPQKEDPYQEFRGAPFQIFSRRRRP